MLAVYGAIAVISPFGVGDQLYETLAEAGATVGETAWEYQSTAGKRHKRPSNVAPPLAAISSSASRGVGLLAQVPHCFRKNATPLAMHRSRKARIQAGSHSAASGTALAAADDPARCRRA